MRFTGLQLGAMQSDGLRLGRLSAELDFFMVGDYATRRATPKNDVATFLTHNNKTKFLKSPNCLSTGEMRKARRHELEHRR